MFLTANALVQEFGVDKTIAKFFVDREPPKDNLYWKDKLLYLRPQPGYIFLPLIVDLFYRSGVQLEELLSEEFITTLEQIGHYAAQEEFNLIAKKEAIESCKKLVEVFKDDKFLNDLAEYLNGGQNEISALTTPFKALHRGDLFLFSLCVLKCDEEKKMQLVKTWFALISTLLLLDDSEDYDSDLETGDENAFVESGSNQEGFAKLKSLLAENLHHITLINAAMANGLHQKFIALAEKPGIKKYLNA
jgi:hypothetical protein